MISSTLRITDQQFANAIKDLGQFVAIPCVSNPNSPDYNMQDLENAAEFASQKLRELNFTVRKVSIRDSAPFVLAESIVDVALPTLLLYAHYDVQPVDRDKWKSDPFVMEERDGRLYGRGSSDDKAGIIGILTAIRAFRESGRSLPVNIKILFEGEEEYGSENMGGLVAQEAKQLHANALIVLDAMNRASDTGSLNTSTRGLINLRLQVDALEKPIHSGLGCLAPDPAQAIAALVYSLRHPRAIPGFMNGFQSMSDSERELLKASSLDAEAYAKENGVLPGAQLRGDPQVSIYERTVEEPSISIVNMTCGLPNGGNSIQSTASATIGVRVLPGQNPDEVGKAVIDYLQSQAVLYQLPVKIEQRESGCYAWKADLNKPYSLAYLEALKENFPKAAVMPCGGALPLLRVFEQAFPEIEIVCPGVEDPDTSAHSHNESQHIELFRNAINSLIAFFERVGQK